MLNIIIETLNIFKRYIDTKSSNRLFFIYIQKEKIPIQIFNLLPARKINDSNNCVKKLLLKENRVGLVKHHDSNNLRNIVNTFNLPP